jgi:integrase
MSSVAFGPGMAALVLFGTFFLLLVARVPVAFALGLACLPVVIIEDRLSPMVIFNETFKAYNSFILLAVPFFLLTANLMNVGGITDRLVRLSRALVGHFPGGLAQINVVLSIFFAGVSGSSTADAASQSKIFIEAQTKEGYDLSFSVAITAVSAVMAVIIPPSILMIVWGGVLTVSIGALMLAGIIPGLLIGLAQMATVHVYTKRRNYPTYPRASLRDVHDGEYYVQAVLSVYETFHRADGHETPTADEKVRAVLSGIRRTIGVAPVRKRAATSDIVLGKGRSLRELRDRAILLLGFAGAFRRSELVALDVVDIEWTTEGALVTIRRSKTDQEGLGRKVAIPHGEIACPVAALKAWLEAASITESAVFRRIFNKRAQRITDRRLAGRNVASVVKAGAAKLGFDPSTFGGHSLRSGLVTTAVKRGVNLMKVCDQTGHKSLEMLRVYSRDAELFAGNAAAGLL